MTARTVCQAAAIGAASLVGVLLHTAGAHADIDRGQKAPVPVQPTQAALQLQPGWPSLQNLLKLPDWMNLNLEFTAEPMAGINPQINSAGAAASVQQLVISSAIGSGVNKPAENWDEFDHWRLGLQLSAFSGDPNLDLALGAAFPLQTAAHPQGLWLSEASLERNRGTGNVAIKAGLMALNPSFLESPIFDSYIHSALNNTLNLLIPGLPINPFVAPGGELRWHNAPGSELRFGSYWLDPETALASMLGVNPQQPAIRGTLQIVQWTFSDLPGSKAVAEPINSNNGPIERQLPDPVLQLGAFTTTASSTLQPAGSNQGLNGSLTLQAPLPIGLDNRVWVAVSNGLNSDINPFPLFIAGGWLNQGLIPSRPLDVLALGFGRTSFSPQLSPGTDEAVVELNYAININAQLSLQPVIQWIVNPGGGNAGGGAVAGGLQVTLSL